MATAVKRRQPQQEQQTKDGLSIGYRVIDTELADSGGTLSRATAINAMLVQAAVDQGVVHSNYSINRESPYSFTGSTSYKSVDGTPQGPPSDPLAGPYPKITDQVTIAPPQPKEMLLTLEKIAEKKPDQTPNIPMFESTSPSLLLLPGGWVPQKVLVTPPHQNRLTTITFEGVIFPWYKELVAECAGKLNDASITLNGIAYPKGHLMLLSATLTENIAGPEVISLGYAGLKNTVTRNGMTEVKPWSVVSVKGKLETQLFEGIEEPKLEVQLRIEHRVWEETSYDGLFTGVNPNP